MHPKLNDLRALERRTLQTISEMSEFIRLGEISETVRNWRNLIQPDRGGINVHLALSLDIRADKGKMPLKRRVDIGALVVPSAHGREIQRASYSLIICENDDPKKGAILRKLHFDFEPVAHRNPDEPKPSMHIQICGKLSQHHLQAGYRKDTLDHWHPAFEKPRIPSAPMSLAILLNWTMLEFQTDATARAILRNSRWRALVADAEHKVLCPYFKSAVDFLEKTRNDKMPFTEHHLYEVTAI